MDAKLIAHSFDVLWAEDERASVVDRLENLPVPDALAVLAEMSSKDAVLRAIKQKSQASVDRWSWRGVESPPTGK